MTQISWFRNHRQRDRFNSWVHWYDVNTDNTEERSKTNVSLHTSTLKNGWNLLATGYKGREGLFASMGQGNIFSGFILTRLLKTVDRLEKQGQLRTTSSTERNYCCFAQDSFLADTNK
jgi:hypothetical protein